MSTTKIHLRTIEYTLTQPDPRNHTPLNRTPPEGIGQGWFHRHLEVTAKNEYPSALIESADGMLLRRCVYDFRFTDRDDPQGP